MSKIYQAFENKKAFIPFIIGGDPSLDVTKELLIAMEQAGADLIEIGIPFSDPIAEGVVIQEADERSLAAGTTTDKLFDMVKEVTDIPVAVGFGISTPEQAKKVASLSDGSIVGSAIVKIVAQYGKDSVPKVAEYVKQMKEAVAEA